VAVVVAVGIVLGVATNAFGFFGQEVRVEVNGVGRAAEIAVAWPGEFVPVAVGEDVDLAWSDVENRRDGVVVVVASGVGEGVTCRILVDGVEVATGVVEGGRVGCSVDTGRVG
jgi:hypothetical protein